MNGNDQFSLGAKLSELDGKIGKTADRVDELNKSLDKMQAGVWKRLEDHANRIPVIEDRVNDLRRFGWFIVSTVVVQILVLLFKRG